MKPLDSAYLAIKKIALSSAAKTANLPKPVIPDAKPVNMKNIKTDRFNVGFASCDITPKDIKSHTYWMAGYGIAKKIRGVLDPLTASAMWIDCGDGQGMLLISCDLIGLTGYEVNELRQSLTEFCCVPGWRHITVS